MVGMMAIAGPHRDDPCYPAYFNSSRFIQRNVLVSNLGIIAKGGDSHQQFFAVTDIRNAQPIAGVNLEIYNFQQQQIGSATTDADGFANVELPEAPFAVIGKSGQQTGYLRLQDGNALSLSKFDVAGKYSQKGLKGFIYGERGVWRPGDSIYLNFVLEDKLGKLPPNYPITFELTDPRGQLQEKRIISEQKNLVYPVHFKTDAGAPTGNWTARILVGGVTFSKVLKVETIKPNRLKIDLDFGKEYLSAQDDPVDAKLQVNWLHGAPRFECADGGRVTIASNKH